MQIVNQRDYWAGLLFLSVGLASAIGAWVLYPLGGASDPGPGYFPLGLGTLLAALGGIVLASSLGRKREQGVIVGQVAWRPLLVVSITVLLFALLLPRLGLFVAVPVLVIGSAFATAEFRWKEVLVSAVALTALCYGIFVWALNLSIPH